MITDVVDIVVVIVVFVVVGVVMVVIIVASDGAGGAVAVDRMDAGMIIDAEGKKAPRLGFDGAADINFRFDKSRSDAGRGSGIRRSGRKRKRSRNRWRRKKRERMKSRCWVHDRFACKKGERMMIKPDNIGRLKSL